MTNTIYATQQAQRDHDEIMVNRAESDKHVTTFQVGRTYSARSVCDHNCIWSFEVTKRTAKFITLDHDGETMRVGVRAHDGEEWASPFGTFSMCPVIRAGREVC